MPTWWVVRAENEGKTWQSAFSHYDDAVQYVDEMWRDYKAAKKTDPTIRFHVFIDQENGPMPQTGEFQKK